MSWQVGLARSDGRRMEAEDTGRMEKKPMSPVSVVVFNMLSRGPGEGKIAAFSLIPLSGRMKEWG